MSRRTVALLSALAVVALLAGCAPGLSPRPPVEREAPRLNEDRPSEEVRRSLAALDPCALLAIDPDEAALAGVTGTPSGGLFDCELPGIARVELLVDFDADARFWSDRTSVGGSPVGAITAYRQRDAVEGCSVLLPVDFGHAIRFRQLREPGDDCTLAESSASRAAVALRSDPRSLARAGEDGLLACDALAAVAGTPAAPAGAEPRPLAGRFDSLASCGLWDASDASDASDAESLTGPAVGFTLDTFVPFAEWARAGARAELEVVTIAGVPALVQPGGHGGCTLSWDARPASDPRQAGLVLRADLVVDRCEDAERLATELVPLLAVQEPAEPGPERLLYAKGDEQDTAAFGGCADALDAVARECAPVREGVTVPSTPTEVLARGEADPDALCAAAQGPVSTVMGQFRAPLVARQDTVREDAPFVCELVEPGHSLVLQLRASTDALADRPSAARGEAVELGGHRAELGEIEGGTSEYRRTARIALGSPDEAGYLEVKLVVRPEREDGADGEADRAMIAQLEPLAATLARSLLGR
ncbi:hypothetical protein [Agromyces soli]|uniref:DUF3558 domain-containing protein n=1 Tax=Agromyces soli TaxID=659012 RepID=A0ABY4AXP8_9MICO|nr:hypothetical protein [Agromyces soli]UOE26881.1 hypothetical protein MTP13_03605 [Agromyces soli]